MNLKNVKKELLGHGRSERGHENEQQPHTNPTSAAPATDTTSSSSSAMDSEAALQNFLDSTPISKIPGIQSKNSKVLELKADDSLRDAIKVLMEKNMFGAPIADSILSPSNDTATKKASNRYIGFIHLPTMVLWCLEEMHKKGCFQGDAEEEQANGFFSLLEMNHPIGDTKIRELAKSFLWDPFFPVHLEDDTLFRALLMFSNHKLHVLPVTDKTNAEVVGFITQNALIELLLQSSGAEWFDGIAHSTLSDFRFNNEEGAPQIYADQSIWEALRVLWQSRAGAAAVVERENKELVGNLRSFDIHLLLDNDELFSKIRTTTMAEFIRSDASSKGDHDREEGKSKGFVSGGGLRLKDNFLTTMKSPVTHRMSDSLESAMRTMVKTRSETSFVTEDDGSRQISRVLTSRNIIMQFAPPGVDSRLRGGGFFETALEQTGCRFERGILFRNG